MRNGAVVLLAVALLASWTVTEEAFATGRSFKGQKAPEIMLSKAANCKEKPTLAKLKGKAVLVEFWATWCPPCRKSIPHLIGIHNKYKDKGLVVIGITKEDPATVKTFMQQNGMTYIVGIDAAGRTNKAYGIRSIPTAYLIGPDGIVVWEGHPMSLKESDIEAVLEKVEKK
ncbi:MAG: TlpA family protein disulfide reductase [Planctomycetes bacterium]|nr:TlpA family protein disulfide reductase [Planctomycetota bacterium]